MIGFNITRLVDTLEEDLSGMMFKRKLDPKKVPKKIPLRNAMADKQDKICFTCRSLGAGMAASSLGLVLLGL